MGLSWSRFKDHWLVLVLASFIVMVCGVLPGQGVGLLQRLGAIETSSVTAILLSVASILLAQVIGAFFQVGITRVWLQAARGETPELGTLFTGGDRFLPMLGLTILMSLIVVTGFALFIVPGVILGLGLFFSQYYVVDAEMGPIEAMKASWAVTKGQKGELFLLGFAGLGIVLLGLVMCCVGVIATAPIFWVATAIAYTRVSGRAAAA